MKKIVSLVLVCLMLVCCSAMAEEIVSRKAGQLAGDTDGSLHIEHLMVEHPEMLTKSYDIEIINYASLTDMVLALKRGDIYLASMGLTNAEYLIARNEGYRILESKGENVAISYAMLTLSENEELYNKINQVIIDMKADGSMEALTEKEITAYLSVDTDPAVVELPKFEGAETVRVAVSGDLPPMDLVLASGEPAGFNVALLSEISNRLEINIELVTVTADARLTALASDRVDFVFWTYGSYCPEHDFSAFISVEDTLVTEPYFYDDNVRVVYEK